MNRKFAKYICEGCGGKTKVSKKAECKVCASKPKPKKKAKKKVEATDAE